MFFNNSNIVWIPYFSHAPPFPSFSFVLWQHVWKKGEEEEEEEERGRDIWGTERNGGVAKKE